MRWMVVVLVSLVAAGVRAVDVVPEDSALSEAVRSVAADARPIVSFGGSAVRELESVRATVLYDRDSGEVVGLLAIDPVAVSEPEWTIIGHFADNWDKWLVGTAVAAGTYLVYDNNRGGGSGGSSPKATTYKFENAGDVNLAIGQGNTQTGRSDNNSTQGQ